MAALAAASGSGLGQGLPLLDARGEELALQEMAHFVGNLDQCVTERLLGAAWGDLERVGGCCGVAGTGLSSYLLVAVA